MGAVAREMEMTIEQVQKKWYTITKRRAHYHQSFRTSLSSDRPTSDRLVWSHERTLNLVEVLMMYANNT
jgi:hypothetical protein